MYLIHIVPLPVRYMHGGGAFGTKGAPMVGMRVGDPSTPAAGAPTADVAKNSCTRAFRGKPVLGKRMCQRGQACVRVPLHCCTCCSAGSEYMSGRGTNSSPAHRNYQTAHPRVETSSHNASCYLDSKHSNSIKDSVALAPAAAKSQRQHRPLLIPTSRQYQRTVLPLAAAMDFKASSQSLKHFR